MKNESSWLEENTTARLRNWTTLHSQAVHKLESSMIHFCKARLSMVGALQQRRTKRETTKYDPFLPTLKGLQHCLLRRYTLQIRHHDTAPSAIDSQGLASRPEIIFQELLEQHPTMAAQWEKNSELTTYIQQLGHYVHEKNAILHPSPSPPQAQQENQESHPPQKSATIESSWSPPPLPISPLETMESEGHGDSSYQWLPSHHHPFLAQQPTPESPPLLPQEEQRMAIHTLEEKAISLPQAQEEESRSWRSRRTTKKTAPPPWIAPTLQRNRTPRKRSSSAYPNVSSSYGTEMSSERLPYGGRR
jgi:hypothetical protein